MVAPHAPESFPSLLLRHRGRTGLIQREVAARADVSLRSVQDWERGAKFPSAERLQALLQVLLDNGGLTPGHEAREARGLWEAVEREAARMRTPFDAEWFAGLLATRAPVSVATPAPLDVAPHGARVQDWGEAPDGLGFVGRADELEMLRGWILGERSRLVVVLGFGGIGKTSLTARLAQIVAPGFERVYWRSLRNAPPVGEWLAGALGFVSDQRLAPPPSEAERITALLQHLRTRRCLLVLDNSETLFEPGQREGRYRSGMEGYGRLFLAIGESVHQSCLVMTSREAPPELAMLGSGVRELELGGFSVGETRALLADKQLRGEAPAWDNLVERYGGNGLALKIVGETIRQIFDGDVPAFLEEAAATYGTVFGGIRRLLDAQAERLSPVEQEVLTRLAVEREPISLAELSREMAPTLGRGAIVECIETLRRRSLVERGERGATFTLQSMVLEYVTDRLVETATDEIGRGQTRFLVEQPLIKAQAKEFVRQIQERLIGGAILQRLESGLPSGTGDLLALLDGWRGRPTQQQGYGPGNVVNLLRLQRGDLRGLDLSRLAIRQAYLAQVDVQGSTLAGSHLAESVLAEAFYFPPAVALSADGALLAAGTSTGEVWLWRVADRTPLLQLQGHSGGVWGAALSADGRLAASSGEDGTVRLWDATRGRALATLRGHAGTVRGVALSADGRRVASGGGDGTVRVWDASSGQPLLTLEGHSGGVWGVALSADGRLLASGSDDGSVRLWEGETGRPLAALQGTTGGVMSVALSADGEIVAGGGEDGVVRVWDTTTHRVLATLHGDNGVVWRVALSREGQLLATGAGDGTVRLWSIGPVADVEPTPLARPSAALRGHAGVVCGVALSADGRLVASGSDDGSVRLWEGETGRPLAVLHGHRAGVRRVAVSADGRLVASGGEDPTVQVWEVGTGRSVATIHGHAGAIWGVALSGDGQLAASGGADGALRLWDVRRELPLASVAAHVGGVWDVALSDDGRLVATGGGDGTLRLWDAETGRQRASLHGHAGVVWRVAVSGDGQVAASGGADGSVRVWDTRTGALLDALHGHTGVVWRVALSAHGERVASAGEDGTVRLWDVSTGRWLATLRGHTGTIRGVAISADGAVLASCGGDGTVRLWDAHTARQLATLRGHTGGVFAVALSADGRLVVSGGFDGTVRLWDARTADWLRTLQAQRRYDGLDITELTGVTEAQRAALLALGAVEQPTRTHSVRRDDPLRSQADSGLTEEHPGHAEFCQ
jgi:WD40 repeat protein/transcriptional regulator with XRE-family HTH domain